MIRAKEWLNRGRHGQRSSIGQNRTLIGKIEVQLKVFEWKRFKETPVTPTKNKRQWLLKWYRL